MISEGMKNNSTITSLDLRSEVPKEITRYINMNWFTVKTDNNIETEGAFFISESLKTNTTLTSLDLDGDYLILSNSSAFIGFSFINKSSMNRLNR